VGFSAGESAEQLAGDAGAAGKLAGCSAAAAALAPAAGPAVQFVIAALLRPRSPASLQLALVCCCGSPCCPPGTSEALHLMVQCTAQWSEPKHAPLPPTSDAATRPSSQYCCGTRK
jgi:hypothetical protein